MQNVIKEAEVVFRRRLKTLLSQRDFDGAHELETELAALKALAERHVSGKRSDDDRSGKGGKDGSKGAKSSSKSSKSKAQSHKAHLSPTWNKVLATAAGYLVKRFKVSDGTATVCESGLTQPIAFFFVLFGCRNITLFFMASAANMSRFSSSHSLFGTLRL